MTKDKNIGCEQLSLKQTASYLKKHDKLKNNKVILTIMSDLGVINALNKIGICVDEVDVGDKYVYQSLIENDLSLGGENSGHIILFDHLNTGDGVLIATFLIEIFRKEGMIFEDYLKDVNSYFTRNVNLAIKNKRDIIRNEIIKNKIFEIKKSIFYKQCYFVYCIICTLWTFNFIRNDDICEDFTRYWWWWTTSYFSSNFA